MSDQNIKFVDFDKYCEICKHTSKLETEHPCDECLKIPARSNSHKPEYYEEK